MTLPVLRQLRDLVAQGAVIVGNKPMDSPSLADDEKELQPSSPTSYGAKRSQRRTVSFAEFGKGRVYSGMSANEVLTRSELPRDFEYTKPETDTTLMFLHRKLADGDIYFVDNRKDRAESVNATFRVDGKTPELWDAATGASQPLSYRIAGGRTTIPLHLDPYGSVFVVFRKAATATSQEIPEEVETPITDADETLNRDWRANFAGYLHHPRLVTFDRLESWSDNSDVNVKYFSGTATYSKTIEIPASAFRPGAHLWLDLGDVKELAEVMVNGHDLGILWKTPYKVDVTSGLRPGAIS